MDDILRFVVLGDHEDRLTRHASQEESGDFFLVGRSDVELIWTHPLITKESQLAGWTMGGRIGHIGAMFSVQDQVSMCHLQYLASVAVFCAHHTFAHGTPLVRQSFSILWMTLANTLPFW